MVNKYSFMIVFSICFYQFIYSQQQNGIYPSSCFELILNTKNTGGNTINFSSDIQSSVVWDYDFTINSNFINTSVTTTGDINGSQPAQLKGWDFTTQSNDCNAPLHGFGLYKISTIDSYFFFDCRDCRYYVGYSGTQYGQVPDIWLLYDNAINKFYYSISVDPHGWTEITNGATIRIWDIFDQSGNPNVDGFQPSNPSGLQIINSSGNPQLQWTVSEPATAAKYHVYRNNVKITGTPVATTSFFDYDVAFGSNIHQTYKIQAVSGDGSKTSPGYSNSVTINAAPADKKASFVRIGALLNAKNYPNPFNPSTTIQYELSDESFVTVNVFDMLGREVEQLANEYQTMGFKTIHFDSKNLPAGIYYYSIRAGSKSDIKSMIVLK